MSDEVKKTPAVGEDESMSSAAESADVKETEPMQTESANSDNMTADKPEKPNLVIPIAAGGGVLVLALGGLALISNQPGGTEIDVSPTVSQQILDEVSYQDGIYYTEATYYVGAIEANETVGVTVTVADGAISSVAIVQLEAGAVVENEYLEEFVVKLNDIVVGKPLEDIAGMELVSGSTLTSDAFKDAVADVQDQATES